MFALKKRASKGRGRGRLGKKSSSSSSGMFTLQSSAKKKTKAERRILNEFEKGEVRFVDVFFLSSVKSSYLQMCVSDQVNLDDKVFQLWVESPDAEKSYLSIYVAIVPEEGLWKGCRFVFLMKFPHEEPYDYPNREPQVNLVSGHKIYHPNINYDGAVCLGYRRQNPWKASWGIKTVAYSLIGVLSNPNPENPQDGCKEVAALMRKDVGMFERNVKRSLRGETMTIEGKSCLFSAVKELNKIHPVPKDALILAGKGHKRE